MLSNDTKNNNLNCFPTKHDTLGWSKVNAAQFHICPDSIIDRSARISFKTSRSYDNFSQGRNKGAKRAVHKVNS